MVCVNNHNHFPVILYDEYPLSNPVSTEIVQEINSSFPDSVNPSTLNAQAKPPPLESAIDSEKIDTVIDHTGHSLETFPIPETKIPSFEEESLPGVGYVKEPIGKILEKVCCRRPGCLNTFPPDAYAFDQRYCSASCRNALRLVRKRLLHWFQLTGCIYARFLYEFFGGTFRPPS